MDELQTFYEWYFILIIIPMTIWIVADWISRRYRKKHPEKDVA